MRLDSEPAPTNRHPGLTRSQRFELQERLNERGFEASEPDGLIGPRTLEALKAFQVEEGLAPDGYAGQRILRALKGPILLR